MHNEIQSRLSDTTDLTNQQQNNGSKSNDRSVNYFDAANTDKNNRNIIDTYPNEAAPGKINSLKRIIQMKNVHINSCFREKYISTNPSDFKYTIPNEIKNVISMKLASIEIPNSWYLYSEKENNHFSISIYTDSKNTSFNIFVPDGNNNSETLVEYLKRILLYESKMKIRMIQINY